MIDKIDKIDNSSTNHHPRKHRRYAELDQKRKKEMELIKGKAGPSQQGVICQQTRGCGSARELLCALGGGFLGLLHARTNMSAQETGWRCACEYMYRPIRPLAVAASVRAVQVYRIRSKKRYQYLPGQHEAAVVSKKRLPGARAVSP